MKELFPFFLPATAGLLFCTASASAISITVNEDSATRLDFTVNWGASYFVLPDFATYTVNFPPTGVLAFDENLFVQISFSSIFSSAPGTWNSLLLYFDESTSSRELSSANLLNIETGEVASESDYGVDIMPVDGNDYAARFVVGEALPPDSVPDGGMTVAMLSLALGGLGLLRRKF